VRVAIVVGQDLREYVLMWVYEGKRMRLAVLVRPNINASAHMLYSVQPGQPLRNAQSLWELCLPVSGH
jgi:hypothetical protein